METISTKIVDNVYMRNLPTDRWEALSQISSDFWALDRAVKQSQAFGISDYFDQYVKFASLAESMLDSIGIEYPDTGYRQAPDINKTVEKIRILFINFSGKVTAQYYNDQSLKKDMMGDKGYDFKLKISERDEIQRIINGLRESVQGATFLAENHKRRLLIRLEKMQSELHKVLSDYDVFLGAVVDAADAAGQAGDKGKPLVDRFKEIIRVIRKSEGHQSRPNGGLIDAGLESLVTDQNQKRQAATGK